MPAFLQNRPAVETETPHRWASCLGEIIIPPLSVEHSDWFTFIPGSLRTIPTDNHGRNAHSMASESTSREIVAVSRF